MGERGKCIIKEGTWEACLRNSLLAVKRLYTLHVSADPVDALIVLGIR